MILEPTRRGLITGLVSFVAAPAIVRAKSIMPIKVINEDLWQGQASLHRGLVNDYPTYEDIMREVRMLSQYRKIHAVSNFTFQRAIDIDRSNLEEIQ